MLRISDWWDENNEYEDEYLNASVYAKLLNTHHGTILVDREVTLERFFQWFLDNLGTVPRIYSVMELEEEYWERMAEQGLATYHICAE